MLSMRSRLLILCWCALWSGVGLLVRPAADAAPGLLANAKDSRRTVTFTVPAPHVTLAPGDSVHPQLGPEFEVEWRGEINLVRAGEYRFFLASPATVQVAGRDAAAQPLALDAGAHPLVIRLNRAAGAKPARVRLEWESGFFRREPVPASVFSHSETLPELAASATHAKGRALFENLNCVACHAAPGSIIGTRPGPDLSRIGERASTAWMFHWLDRPQKFRAAAVMPSVLANAQDRADVAAYLATLTTARPRSDAVTANAATGAELLAKTGCTACHGEDTVSLAGLGSKWRDASQLAAFLMDPLAVDSSGRMPDMALSRVEAESLATHLLASKNAAFETAPPAGNPSRGRTLVAMTGCANCHVVKDTQGTVTPHVAAPPPGAMDATKGCLADAPAAPSPRYALTADDRAALRAFVQSPDVSRAPVQDFARNLGAFQCTACHEWNGPATLKPDMPPPALTTAGDKLRASWLERVLLDRKRVRPWMELRMPHYGAAVQPLVHQFAAQAGAEPGEGATLPEATRAQVAAGVQLLGAGEGGLACINCHDFRGAKSIGQLRGPDLVEMNARIRTDWLQRWLRDPARIQPGTAMPAFFSDMPAAKAEGMIASVLHALRAGVDMPMPPGLGGAAESFVQTVSSEPVLLRTFMPESSPRSIAVGLPGGQNYCFDAQTAQLRYAWSGGFVDMKPAWSARGGEPATPLGKVWFKAGDDFPLRVGAPDAKPKAVFRGYRFEGKTPVMLYAVDGVAVVEKISATPDGRALLREFQLGTTTNAVWFAAPASPGVTWSSDAGNPAAGPLKVGGRFTVKMEAR
jgi:cbb3-type cytochrome oxidase cytochrome c subunit